MATAIPFILVLIYLQVNWALASAVVVAESTWGFEALKRSKILVKGRRGLALFLCLVFMFWYVVLEKSTTSTSLLVTDEPKCLFLFVMAVQIVVTSSFKSMFMLFQMVLNTVIYVYCKAILDEEKIGGEYVRLAVDDHENVAYDGVVYVNSVSKLDAFCEV
ncbi:hypothetical protein TIFTF001_050128 [Ficus carica]|uniref:Uncharacterized protein n=1 Tax=Ficus carica TaxID=3494 RepID=A0AA88CXK5_FICCA|nr:hypothetical protein TIFTF001_050118 [Ficus carica]GMN21312.1 hypothetical protein TIFTF001_050121 [Ficus carica]GMN21340.1 hypothetical protein TIFTF001_050126 [Ficus carica]GMN21358.1 hypothetical protein TIFTF001_050128 [Ficus carica]